MFDNMKRKHHLSTSVFVSFAVKPNFPQTKIMPCVWWNSNVILYYEFLEISKTIVVEVYSSQFQRVSAAWLQKQPERVNRRRVVFLHDNASPDTAKATRDVMKTLGCEILPNPGYPIRLKALFDHGQLWEYQFRNRVNAQKAVIQFLD